MPQSENAFGNPRPRDVSRLDLLRPIVDAAPDAMVVVDRSGRILLANREAEKLFGYAADELHGKSIETLVPERFRQRHVRERAGFYREPRVRPMGTSLALSGLRKDGVEIPLAINLSPLDTGEGIVVLAAIRERADSGQAIAAEQRLRESELRYRTVVELSPDVIAVHRKGRLVYVNPAAAKVFGAPAETLLGTNVADWIHADSRDALAEPSVGRAVEARLLRFDGTVMDAEITTMPILHDGSPAVLAIVHDVTARKETEARSRELFENVPIGLYRTSKDGAVLAANPAMAAILGYPSADALFGMRAGERLYAVPEEREAWAARVVREGTVTAYPMRLRRADGTEVWVENSVRTVRDDEGRPLYFEGALKDISAQKRDQIALEERARLAQFTAEVAVALAEVRELEPMLKRCAEIIVEHLGAAFARFWTLSETGDVLELRASAGLYTHLDGPHARVPVGRFKIGLIASERKPHLTNSVIGDPRVSDQLWAKREGMVAFAGHPLLLEDRLLGVMAMFSRAPLSPTVLDALASVAKAIALAVRDRATIGALRGALERAETADKLKGDFLSNMSHEIRTPLNVILGYSELIADELGADVTGSVRTAIDAIRRASTRLLETVHGVLDLSRLERGDFPVQPERVDIVQVADDIVRRVRELASRKGLVLRVEHEAPSLEVWIDGYCIRRSLERVLDNALKFTNSGGTILVKSFHDESGAPCLSVRDDGIGIDPSYLKKGFQPFSQEEPGATRRFEGTGIGLALCQRYMERNDAELIVESEKGVGTVVTFRLPAVADRG